MKRFGLFQAVAAILLSLASVPMAVAMDTSLTSMFERNQLDRALKFAREKVEALRGSTLQLAPRAIIREQGIETVRFNQSIDGVPVLGGITVVETGLDGQQKLSLQSEILNINTVPTLNSEQALQVVSSELKSALRGATTQLKILPEEDRSGARLVYWVEYPSTLDGEGGDLIVDAHSGDLIAKMSKIIHIAPVDVFSAKNQGKSFTVNSYKGPFGPAIPMTCTVRDLATGKEKVMEIEDCNKLLNRSGSECQIVNGNSGEPIIFNFNGCLQNVRNQRQTVPTLDESSKRAMENSKKALEYYLDTHSRDSFDGKGAVSRSLVQIGLDFANAAWIDDLGLMIYGGGDGISFGDFTANADVAGHEMTHGVVSKTADLIYRGESGALNEAFADIFGLMIANTDEWIVGKGIYLHSTKKGIRDLQDPNSISHRFVDKAGQMTERPMPKHMSEKFDSFGRTCDENNDGCYVHGNSTIISHAFYQMVQRIGKDKAERIAYQALTRYLSETSNFKDAASAFNRSCSNAYDAGTCASVKESFAVVGL